MFSFYLNEIVVYDDDIIIYDDSRHVYYANYVKMNTDRTKINRYIVGHIPCNLWHLKN